MGIVPPLPSRLALKKDLRAMQSVRPRAGTVLQISCKALVSRLLAKSDELRRDDSFCSLRFFPSTTCNSKAI